MDNLEGLICIDDEDVRSYSLACLNSLKVVHDNDPEKMICLLRGGYPPTRIVHGLAKEYLGKNIGIYDIPTSDFLRNKKDLVYSLAKKSLESSIGKPQGLSIFTIDPAITGSSSRQFLADFPENFGKASQKVDSLEGANLNYAFVRFWDKSQDRFSKTKVKPSAIRRYAFERNGVKDLLNLSIYDFGVKSLISEDCPTLLGCDYPIVFTEKENEGIRGQKSEYVVRVNKSQPIHVQNGTETKSYQPQKDQSTSDLFIDIILDRCRREIDKIGSLDVRDNLKSIYYNPSLVDFVRGTF